MKAPKRVVTATCALDLPAHAKASLPHRLPVKTNAGFPKERINELLKDIYSLKVGLPVRSGQVLI
jgi:CxxC motif-containing protein